MLAVFKGVFEMSLGLTAIACLQLEGLQDQGAAVSLKIFYMAF